jgi:hypothetical protein
MSINPLGSTAAVFERAGVVCQLPFVSRLAGCQPESSRSATASRSVSNRSAYALAIGKGPDHHTELQAHNIATALTQYADHENAGPRTAFDSRTGEEERN